MQVPASHCRHFKFLFIALSRRGGFGAPSIYYNYFENIDSFINAYSPDHATIHAFVDGILGDFPFTGKSPVPLYPEFKD